MCVCVPQASGNVPLCTCCASCWTPSSLRVHTYADAVVAADLCPALLYAIVSPEILTNVKQPLLYSYTCSWLCVCVCLYSALYGLFLFSQAAIAASQASAVSTPTAPSSQPLTVQAPPNEPAAPMGPNPAPNPAPEERPANQNLQMNAQGGAMLNEDEINRDWLDWLYTISRAAILLSIVYFYSSFGRFVMVIGAMLLVYL